MPEPRQQSRELEDLRQQYEYAAQEACYAGSPQQRRYANQVKRELSYQMKALVASKREALQRIEAQGIAFRQPPKGA